MLTLIPAYIRKRLMIEGSEEDLKKLKKCHRYGHLCHRVRMLRLLKSEGALPLLDCGPEPRA